MPDLEQPSYEELAARNAELTARVAELLAVVAEQAALIESLRAEVAALRLEAGGTLRILPSPRARRPGGSGGGEGRQAGRRGGRGRARAQGGQKGHPGASLAWAARPDETLAVEPGTCGGCGADLAVPGPGRSKTCRCSISRRPR